MLRTLGTLLVLSVFAGGCDLGSVPGNNGDDGTGGPDARIGGGGPDASVDTPVCKPTVNGVGSGNHNPGQQCMQAGACHAIGGGGPTWTVAGTLYTDALGTAPNIGATITIKDANGAVVRTLKGPMRQGINRVYWDLRYTASAQVRLRTSPMYAEHIVPEPEGRAAPGTNTLTILAPPGTYTVRLTVGGAEMTQPLVVRKDPSSGGTEADIAAQMKALLAIRDDLDQAADAVSRIEAVRVQTDAVARVVDDTTVKRAAAQLAKQFMDLEMNLVDLRLTGRGQDGVRFGSKLISKLGYLANGMSASDHRPTDQHAEVQQILHSELRTHLTALDGLLTKELAGFNELLRQRNIPNVVVRQRPISD